MLDGVSEEWSVTRLQWFSKGFYKVSEQDQQVVIADLRMGLEPSFVFQFAVAELTPEGVKSIPAIQLQPQRDLSVLDKVWRRIWSAGVPVSPAPVNVNNAATQTTGAKLDLNS